MLAREYLEKNFSTFVEELKNLVRIPSISFEGFPKSELDKCSRSIAALFKKYALENVELLNNPGGAPYVYADYLHAKGKPTVLLYAHYDVQPIGDEKKWKSPPFEPTERDGRLFGRGSADDKAGIILPVASISSYIRSGESLPVNVKILIEGEEECGSTNLVDFIKTYRDKLKADCIVIADSGNFKTGVPTIVTSLRGIVALEVTVRVMEHSIHSGTWGGPGPDPIIALSKMIASLQDEEGKIAIPGIYDRVRKLLPVEKESIEKLKYTDELFREQVKLLDGVKIIGPKASPKEKLTRLPSICVNAIESSSRKTVSNSIQPEAWCKIGIRTVPDMDLQETEKMLKQHLLKHAPWGVQVNFSGEQSGIWWITSIKHPAFLKMSESLTKAYGESCVYMGEGGSIPFVEPFSQALGGVPALLVGVEDPYSNAHSENESVHLGDLKKAILSNIYFYESYGK